VALGSANNAVAGGRNTPANHPTKQAQQTNLIAFFVLAYVLTWWIYPLLKFSPLLGLFDSALLHKQVTCDFSIGAPAGEWPEYVQLPHAERLGQQSRMNAGHDGSRPHRRVRRRRRLAGQGSQLGVE
jgi:hypothetical protein